MAAEPDPPLADIIKKRHGARFETVRRGYSTSQVDMLLSAIASRIDALQKQLREGPASDDAIQGPDSTDDDAPGSSKGIARLVRLAEGEVEQMREEANAEAAKIRSDAQAEAGRITKDARDEATRVVDEVQAFLDQVEEDTRRIPAEAEERRRQMLEETRAMQERLLSVADALDSVLDAKGP